MDFEEELIKQLEILNENLYWIRRALEDTDFEIIEEK